MARKKPKTKLEEFEEKILKSKSKEDLTGIVKKLENYVKLHPSEEGYILLSFSKYQLGDIEESLKWIHYTQSLKAKLFEIIVYISASKFKEAYNLIKELEKLNLSEEMKKELKPKEIFALWSMWEYERVLKLWDEDTKQLLLDFDIELGHKIIKKVEGYKKAKEVINRDKKLKKAIKKLEGIILEKIPDSKIIPILEEDVEYPIEDLWVYIIIPKNTSYEEIEKIEEEIIDEIIFNQGIDINYSFMKIGESEAFVQT